MQPSPVCESFSHRRFEELNRPCGQSINKAAPLDFCPIPVILRLVLALTEQARVLVHFLDSGLSSEGSAPDCGGWWPS
jgi:hypothetical protein